MLVTTALGTHTVVAAATLISVAGSTDVGAARAVIDDRRPAPADTGNEPGIPPALQNRVRFAVDSASVQGAPTLLSLPRAVGGGTPAAPGPT